MCRGLIFLLALAGSNAVELPKEFVVCSRSTPNLNECVRDAIQATMPKMLEGLPSLGFPSLEPLRIGRIVIDEKKKDGRPVDVDMVYENVVVNGIKDGKITSAVADWDNYIVSFEAEFPEVIDLSGDYIVDGNILILPIYGKGKFDIKLEGFKAHIKVHGTEEIRDGERYMKVDRLAFTFDTDHLVLNYENLFEGNALLGEQMNSFLNANWRDILTEMTPAVEAAHSLLFQDIAAKVFHNIPIDKLAPP